MYRDSSNSLRTSQALILRPRNQIETERTSHQPSQILQIKSLIFPKSSGIRTNACRIELGSILEKLVAMMPRPMLLVFLLLTLIITSQFEWKQQLVSDMESSPTVVQKQQQISKREEVVKEKIILSQEKHIRRLNELVRNLREQLIQCRGSNNTIYGTSNSPTANVISLGQKQILDD